MDKEELLKFYQKARKKIIDEGYQKEIDLVNNRHFSDMTPKGFLWEYVYVVLNSGMKNQTAEKMYRKFFEEGSKSIGHLGKRKAIIQAQLHYKWWFRNLKSNGSVEEMLDYLETLPWIGPTTKYHLARNLGIDVAKPDRHMQFLAELFGYRTPHDLQYGVQKMCRDIADVTEERTGTIDLVLWRFCNLHQNEVKRMKE